MKRGFILLLFSVLCGMVQGQPSLALQELLETEGLRHAAVGISVRKVSDGSEIASYCPGMALTPASTAKLLPAWFALQEKGADYRYCTPVFYTGEIREGILSGDLILQASGDPTPDSRYFPHHTLVNALVAALQKAGVRQIEGRLLVEGAEQGTDIPGSWVWEDISNYYGALCLPFNYRDNTFTLQFRTVAVGTAATLVSVTPALPGTEIRNEVRAGAVKRDDAWIYGGPYSSVLCVRGVLPPDRPVFKVKGALHDPAAAFVAECTESLARKGIPVKGKSVADTSHTELTRFYSPRLEELVFHTNKASVNLFAEALGRLSGGDDWQAGVTALLARAGIDAGGVVVHDACGLSPSNAMPASVLTDLLVYISSRENAAFVRSLPVAGVDGGLSGYCHASPALKNRMRAKTGSMSGVRCLSGYLDRLDGERLAFTVFVNHYTCTVSQLQKAIGRFLVSLL